MAAKKIEIATVPSVALTADAAGTETFEQLKAKMDALKARDGQTLLTQLQKLESDADIIRGKLKGMGVPVPPRINVEITQENLNAVLLTLSKVPKNAGMSLSALETSTGYKGVRLNGIRQQLLADPASIKVTEKGLTKMVTLTKEGLEEAEEIAATEEGKVFLAELDAKIAEAKAKKV